MSVARSRRNLGIVLLFVGIAIGLLGSVMFGGPYVTTRCDNSVCVTTVPPLASYVAAVVGSGVFISGVVVLYIAYRHRFETMFP